MVLTLVAPNINDVAVSDQRAFLPSSAPSLDANETVKKYFPDRVSPSSAVLVVDAGAGGRVDEGPAGEFVAELTSWLERRRGARRGRPGVVSRPWATSRPGPA